MADLQALSVGSQISLSVGEQISDHYVQRSFGLNRMSPSSASNFPTVKKRKNERNTINFVWHFQQENDYHESHTIQTDSEDDSLSDTAHHVIILLCVCVRVCVHVRVCVPLSVFLSLSLCNVLHFYKMLGLNRHCWGQIIVECGRNRRQLGPLETDAYGKRKHKCLRAKWLIWFVG